jgi:hypothetical protein
MRRIALVSATRHVSLDEVARAAAALQRQVSHDLAPLWGMQACVSAFPGLRDIPAGYWPIVVIEEIPESGAAGLHLDRHGSPYCLIELGPTWPLAASHECLAMLVDPSGSRQVWGPSPLAGQAEVGFLVEVSDPCQDIQFGYMINGVLVRARSGGPALQLHGCGGKAARGPAQRLPQLVRSQFARLVSAELLRQPLEVHPSRAPHLRPPLPARIHPRPRGRSPPAVAFQRLGHRAAAPAPQAARRGLGGRRPASP